MRSRDFTAASRLWQQGMVGSRIAKTLGIDERKLYEMTHNHRDLFPRRRAEFEHVSDAEKWLMVEMRANGMTYRAIAEELGREHSTVRRWCHRAGVA